MDVEQTRRMAECVRARRDVLAEILKLALRQQSAIEAGTVEPLLQVLAEKDALVDQLRSVQQQLAPLAAVPAEQRQWPDEESRVQCRRQIDESAKLQAAILEIDARCEQAMVQRREELFDSLRHTTGAAGASRAYAAAAASGPATRPTGATGSTLDFTSG